MSNYETLAKTVNHHFNQRLESAVDMARYNNRHHQLYSKIRNSRLTVYQKDRLLQLLGDPLEAKGRHPNHR